MTRTPTAYAQNSTQKHQGVVRSATQAEADAGVKSDVYISPKTLTDTLGDPVTVPHGGTGLTTITDHGVMVGSGVGAVTPLAVGSNGQVLLGSTGADPIFATLTSSNSSVTFTTGAGALGLTVTQATTTQLGGGETATDVEAIAAASTTVLLTPSNLAALTAANLTALKASDAQAIAASSTAVFLTPSNLAALTAANMTAIKASDAQAQAQSSTSVLLTPANMAAIAAGTNIRFNASPILQSAATTGAAPTGATGDKNIMVLEDGVIMEQFILGGGQTIIAPRMSSAGLLTSLDLTNAEGAEYNFGAALSNSKHAYTIGTSPAFYIELAVTAADVGGLDPFVVGFRKSQANAATFTDYTDFATIGARATTAADVVVLQTDLNNAGEVITNTTDAWTDGQTKTLKVLVSAAGVVTYTINGLAPTVTAAFTFDTGDVVVPFIRHTFGAATPAAIDWVTLKIGSQ